MTQFRMTKVFSIHFSLLLDSDGHIAVTDFGLSKENLEDDKVIVNRHEFWYKICYFKFKV